MAVETTTDFSGPYNANGVTVAFGFTFIAMATDEVAVLLRNSAGVDTVVDPADYTVTLNVDRTGTVTFDSAPASGNEVYILSDVSFEHSIDREDGAPWKAAPENLVNDRAAARDIWLKGRLDRALLVPVGATPPTVGDLEEGKVLGVVGGEIVSLETNENLILLANQALADANAALATITGPLATVTRYSPRPRRWASPSGMLNPLGVAMDCNGERYSYSSDIHDLNDWAQHETGITQLYVNPDPTGPGNDANPGTSEGSPWKSLDKIVSSAPDKSIIDVMYPSFDYNTALAGNYDFGTRRIKIRPKVSERVLLNSWRFSYNLAFLSWVADGDAYYTDASINGGAIQNFADGKYRDQDGLPLFPTYVTSSALVKSTPGSWWWDNSIGRFWCHMIDGRVPDPADGWIPITSFSGGNFLTDGSLTLEGLELGFHGGGAGSAALRVRPSTAFVPAVAKLALKDVLAYGADGNAVALLDMQVATLKRVRGGYSRYDFLNHSSFRSTGTAAEDTTYYEDDCYGAYPGYDRTRSMPTASNSNNITTGHRGANIFRNGTRGIGCPNSFVADVHGCFSMNAGIFPTESTKDGGLFLNNFWNQRYADEGLPGAKMVLIGCGGDARSAGRSVFSNRDDSDTVATNAVIEVADWLGPPSASRTVGTLVNNYETGAAL